MRHLMHSMRGAGLAAGCSLLLCFAASATEFRDCATCPMMVAVPAGTFTMGSPETEPGREITEGPQHVVTIATPFAVSKFEVTFAEWDACVTADACPQAPDAWGRGEMPVINVSWGDAQQYTSWLSRLTGKHYRLPSEAEWEYAARADATAGESWGDDPGQDRANCDGCISPWPRQTMAVGSFKPNAFGLQDMHGNVWEWVEDTWHENYDGAPSDGSAWLQGGDPNYRIIRGGSWRNDTTLVRSAIRFRRNIHVRFDTLGIRVARALSP